MYNNYGYNPYYPQQRFQHVEQPNQQPSYKNSDKSIVEGSTTNE